MTDSKNFFVMAIAVFLIIISVIIIFSNLPSEYNYSFIEDGVEFVSQAEQPGIYIKSLAGEETFIVSPKFQESGSINSYMTQPIAMFSAVLTAQGKTVISLPRLYNASGEMVKCQTNDGDYRTNREIGIEECNSILETGGAVKLLVSFPDSSLQHGRVIVEAGKLTIKPKTYDDTSRIPYTILKTMFSDSDQVIAHINSLVNSMNGGNS